MPSTESSHARIPSKGETNKPCAMHCNRPNDSFICWAHFLVRPSRKRITSVKELLDLSCLNFFHMQTRGVLSLYGCMTDSANHVTTRDSLEASLEAAVGLTCIGMRHFSGLRMRKHVFIFLHFFSTMKGDSCSDCSYENHFAFQARAKKRNR